MIYEVQPIDVSLPYVNDGQLCLGRGLLNPACFLREFKTYPWFPFENFSFSEEDIEIFIRQAGAGSKIYREEMPCRGNRTKVYSIEQPDKLDAVKLTTWLAYHEGIVWSTSGMLIINSYSDYVILSLSEEISEVLFGETVFDLYNASDSVFVKGYPDDPILAQFMAGVQKTWAAR